MNATRRAGIQAKIDSMTTEQLRAHRDWIGTYDPADLKPEYATINAMVAAAIEPAS